MVCRLLRTKQYLGEIVRFGLDGLDFFWVQLPVEHFHRGCCASPLRRARQRGHAVLPGRAGAASPATAPHPGQGLLVGVDQAFPCCARQPQLVGLRLAQGLAQLLAQVAADHARYIGERARVTACQRADQALRRGVQGDAVDAVVAQASATFCASPAWAA